MKKYYLFAAISGAVAVALAIVFLLYITPTTVSTVSPVTQTSKDDFLDKMSAELDFTYKDANANLKDALKSQNITMSSPIILKDKADIDKYCTFLKDKEKQKLVEYCTSTELRDSSNHFLGNIHMIGSPSFPRLVIVLIQVDPLMTQLDDVKTIFTTVTEKLVCNCWQEKKPGGFETVDAWIDGLHKFHTSDTKPHSQSKPISLEGKTMRMDLTTNTQGYIWELLIAK